MAEFVNRGRWSPGQSGNPTKGSKRALTEALQMMSEFDSFDDLTNKRLLAQLVWEGLVSGEMRMLSGRTMELRGKEWVELVKWFYTHIDGTYRSRQEEDERAAKAEPAKVEIVYEMPPQEVKAAAVTEASQTTNTDLAPDANAALSVNASPDSSPYPLTPFPREEGKGNSRPETQNDYAVRPSTPEGGAPLECKSSDPFGHPRRQENRHSCAKPPIS